MILKMSKGRDSYGIVTIRNIAGEIDREYKISGEQLTGRLSRQAPLGCTQQEWESGLVVIAGKACDTGEVYLRADGSLIIKYSEEIIGGKEILERRVRLSAGQWTGIIPAITVDSNVLNNLLGQPIVSIVAGVLTLR